MESNQSNGSNAAERMRRAVSAAVNGKGSKEELQCAAAVLVAELRGRNEPPEQVLLQIKDFLAEAGLRPSYATPTEDAMRPESTIYRDVIAWTIRAYYDEK